jgi:hypothetical protein
MPTHMIDSCRRSTGKTMMALNHTAIDIFESSQVTVLNLETSYSTQEFFKSLNAAQCTTFKSTIYEPESISHQIGRN